MHKQFPYHFLASDVFSPTALIGSVAEGSLIRKWLRKIEIIHPYITVQVHEQGDSLPCSSVEPAATQLLKQRSEHRASELGYASTTSAPFPRLWQSIKRTPCLHNKA
ncbi:hypothetical protein V6N13_102193 [Hibiscus sabdariffa]